MALYTISDLHLPLGVDKPMDIFGKRWAGYVDKLQQNWCAKEEDTVVLGGDFSWAMYLEESYRDFAFISQLPGRKILLKGNHDYWWTTANKLHQYMKDNQFDHIDFLFNNAFVEDDIAICGTKGFPYTENMTMTEQDEKIYQREVGRFRLSIEQAQKFGASHMVAFLHYMPQPGSLFIKEMHKAGITRCYYGHLHGETSDYHREHFAEGIRLQLVSCDFLDFTPIPISF